MKSWEKQVKVHQLSFTTDWRVHFPTSTFLLFITAIAITSQITMAMISPLWQLFTIKSSQRFESITDLITFSVFVGQSGLGFFEKGECLLVKWTLHVALGPRREGRSYRTGCPSLGLSHGVALGQGPCVDWVSHKLAHLAWNTQQLQCWNTQQLHCFSTSPYRHRVRIQLCSWT